MLDLESFLKIFPKSFTKKLNESIIPHNSPLNRNEIAHNLYKELTEFRYHPSTPRDYIIINKGNHVARISPTFYPKDYFVYYFCTKVLEDEIAVNYVEGTYGGLVSQATEKNFDRILDAALYRAEDCASDPICYNTEDGQGVGGLNMAACYSCSLLPENSCEEFNSFLDRSLLIDDNYGFFK